MKKDRLEDFIENNKDGFDIHEPPAGLWDKISEGVTQNEEVKENESKVISINYKRYLYRAVGVVAIFIASYFFHDIVNNSNNINPSIADEDVKQDNFEDITPEIKELFEAEDFYSRQVDIKYEQVKCLSVNYPDISEDVSYEMQELDSVYIDLKNELKGNVGNEEIINAMIQNYRIKLNILEQIQNQLEQINTYEDEEVECTKSI